MKRLSTISFIVIFGIYSSASIGANPEAQTYLKSATDLDWGYLNPLRGNKSPAATDLWGDRTKNVATGMLVKFNPGFSSPPHIHNITYRGIVIDGMLHNDDPQAEHMWLPSGSFWTQPAGEDHITAAKAESNMIYLEIDSGPYLVKPSDQQFDNGERPVNIHRDNIVWLSDEKSDLIQGKQVTISHLWQDSENDNTQGMLLQLKAGAAGRIYSEADEFKVVVISGKLNYQTGGKEKALQPGSYFSSTGTTNHVVSTESEAIIYIRTNKLFKASF